MHHSTSISRMAPGLASSPAIGYCCGIHDGNHSSGIRNGGTGGTAVGGTGVAVVGGLSGGLSCPVPVVVCPCIVIGGSSGGAIVGGLRVDVPVCV